MEHSARLIALLVLGLHSQTVNALNLRDIARVVTAPIVAPIDATKRIIQGDDPKKAVTGPLQSAGRVIEGTSDIYRRAQDTFAKIPRDAIERSLGPDWARAYSALTVSQRVQYELAATSGQHLGKCLQGQACGISELAAAPLAAALRDAYKVYVGHSSPLDPKVIDVLSNVVPANVLHSARWSVGATPDFTIPGFLNSGNVAAGHAHAVTIANLVIFSRQPNLNNRDDWNWLLHELRHVEQYASYSGNPLESIDGFAVEYIKRYRSIERDAQETADQRQTDLDSACRERC